MLYSLRQFTERFAIHIHTMYSIAPNVQQLWREQDYCVLLPSICSQVCCRQQTQAQILKATLGVGNHFSTCTLRKVFGHLEGASLGIYNKQLFFLCLDIFKISDSEKAYCYGFRKEIIVAQSKKISCSLLVEGVSFPLNCILKYQTIIIDTNLQTINWNLPREADAYLIIFYPTTRLLPTSQSFYISQHFQGSIALNFLISTTHLSGLQTRNMKNSISLHIQNYQIILYYLKCTDHSGLSQQVKYYIFV